MTNLAAKASKKRAKSGETALETNLLIGLGALAAVAAALLAARSFSRGRRRALGDDGGYAYIGTDSASCDAGDSGGADCDGGDGGGGGD